MAKKELLQTSAQDQFAKWAKLRRSVDKGLADLEKLSECLPFLGNTTEHHASLRCVPALLRRGRRYSGSLLPMARASRSHRQHLSRQIASFLPRGRPSR